MIKVSVIIPVYNTKKYLKKCVNSVLAQSLDDLEIILVDDGSTDGSDSICDEYRTKGVKVIHQNNKGLSAARNAGLKVATGEYVAFLDSDDYVESNMYQDMYELGHSNSIDIVYCNYLVENTDNMLIRYGQLYLPSDRIIYQPEIRSIIVTEQSQFICWFAVKSLFRLKLLNDHNILFIEKDIVEDTPFNLDAILYAESIWYINKPYYHYVQTPASLMRRNYKENFVNRLNNSYLARIQVSKKHKLTGYEEGLYHYSMTHSLLLLVVNEMYHECSYCERIKALRIIRNSRIVSDAYENVRTDTFKPKMRFIMNLLKYRMYACVALILSIKLLLGF